MEAENVEKWWTFRGNNGFFRGIRAYFPEFIVTLPSVLNNSEQKMDNILTDTPREKELETRDEHFLAEVKGKRVALLLSGGVDSSVVVWEFARLGLHPDCFYIKIGP